MKRVLTYTIAVTTVVTAGLAAAPTADCAPRLGWTSVATECCCNPAGRPATSCAMSCGSEAPPEVRAVTSLSPGSDAPHRLRRGPANGGDPSLRARATTPPILPTPTLTRAQDVARAPRVPLKRYLLACVLRL